MPGDRADDQHEYYMYEPVVKSLRAGFEAFNMEKENISRPSKYDLVVPHKQDTATLMSQADELQSGDMVVWMGLADIGLFREKLPAISNFHASNDAIRHGSESGLTAKIQAAKTMFQMLKQRKVHVIYYQSEVVDACLFKHGEVDEIWDYSWANIEACEKKGDGPKQRYVPLAALSTLKTVQRPQPGPLLFFGGVQWRPVECREKLQAALTNNFNWEYETWDDTAYQQKVLDKSNIYLNMHKACGQHRLPMPVTWRNPKLLNAHALIVSEHSHPKDEEEFAGMIDFVDFEAIPAKYNELASMSAEERQKLADARAELFSVKFDPRRIFQKAGIYELMATPRQ